MKKKWFPLIIVAALAGVLFFSRSIYTYTLPKITADTAAPGQFHYQLPVQRAALTSEDAWTVSMPQGYGGLLTAGAMPEVGAALERGALLIPLDAEDAEALADAVALRQGELELWQTNYDNAVTAVRRQLRQLAAQIDAIQEVLAHDCEELPEMEELAKQVRRVSGSLREERQAKYDARKQELITQYSDDLEARQEEEAQALTQQRLYDQGIFQGQTREMVDREQANLERLASMLTPQGLTAPENLVVAERLVQPGAALTGGMELLSCIPQGGPVTLVVETDAVEGMGEYAGSCTLRLGIAQTKLDIAEKSLAGGGMRFTMEPLEEIPALGTGEQGMLVLRGPMENCMIPAAALVGGGAGVYVVSEWEKLGGAERVTLYYTPVEVKQIYNGQAVILQGVYSGDKVVTSWDREIWDGIEAVWAQ